VALGAHRLAVVRAVTDAADPAAVVAGLRDALETRPRVLTVAGSDSGGGAGIQADIKAIARAGGFPLVAVTALTAQTTTGVHGVVGTPAAFVRDQIRLVAGDIGLDAVKTGMLGTAETVAAVAAELATLDPADEIPIVVDPVMRAEAGSSLLAPGGDDAYRTLLLARATVVTPNLYEAQALAGLDVDDAPRLAQVLHDRHGCAVIVTGGHGATADDVLCDADGMTRLPGVRLDRRTTHGAGCTHSSTLAALLARGLPLRAAAGGAKEAATAAVRHGLPYGAGAGPVDVFGGV
jgi:hydroxymethylpyrimidine/phosphomethylpyrimidine kinase